MSLMHFLIRASVIQSGRGDMQNSTQESPERSRYVWVSKCCIEQSQLVWENLFWENLFLGYMMN